MVLGRSKAILPMPTIWALCNDRSGDRPNPFGRAAGRCSKLRGVLGRSSRGRPRMYPFEKGVNLLLLKLVRVAYDPGDQECRMPPWNGCLSSSSSQSSLSRVFGRSSFTSPSTCWDQQFEAHSRPLLTFSSMVMPVMASISYMRDWPSPVFLPKHFWNGSLLPGRCDRARSGAISYTESYE